MTVQGAIALMNTRTKVVVAGFRPQICQVLEKKNLPYVIWTSQPVKSKRLAEYILVENFCETPEKIQTIAAKLKSFGPFSHVIAGTEESVVAASYLRRALNTRLSEHSIAKSCHDKLIMKQKLKSFDIPMNDFFYLGEKHNSQEIFDQFGTPVVVKERTFSGGKNLKFVTKPNELDGLKSKDKIAERYYDAQEASVESFIQNGEILFTNVTHYHTLGSINLVPADYDSSLIKEILSLNQRVISNLKIHWGLTHLEMYLTKSGPYFGEIAIRPPGGYIMDLIGLSYDFDAWEAFVSIELGIPFDFPKKFTQYSAAWILHPGEGKVKSIEGLDQIKLLPEIVKIKLKAKPNSIIEKRASVGKDIGYIKLSSPSHSQLLNTLKYCQDNLKIEMQKK